MYRYCRLEDKDLLHVLTRCPVLFKTRSYTVQKLKDIVVRKPNLKDLSLILKALVNAETLDKALPAVEGSEDEIERLSSKPI